MTLTPPDARKAAEDFLRRVIDGFPEDFVLQNDRSISHQADDQLRLLQWRDLDGGRPGNREITVEIDQRTGAITYLSANRGLADGDQFAISQDAAIEAARATIGNDVGQIDATSDSWNESRWIITVDRGTQGRSDALVPDLEQIEIDAESGDVLSRTTT